MKRGEKNVYGVSALSLWTLKPILTERPHKLARELVGDYGTFLRPVSGSGNA